MDSGELSAIEIDDLKNLEESLWKTETRFDLKHQEKIFAEDFFEFGRSGKTYNREQMILTDSQRILAKLPLQNFKVHPLDAKHVLVTYVSEVQYSQIEKANRCSIWSRVPDGWQLRFHQGTPVFAPEN